LALIGISTAYVY